MELGIVGRIALVTGAGNGIGACVANMLATEKVRVIYADINFAAAEDQVSKGREQGFECAAVPIDVTDARSIAAALEQARSIYGDVDILVNNAGFTRDNRVARMTEEDWDAVVDVILKGSFLCAKAVLPDMIDKNWGRIINISSRAHLGNPGQANYSSAKAGLLGLTRSLAMENGRHNITVNAVAPGLIDTAAVRSLRHFEKIKANAEASLPLPRLGRVEDVAAAVAFLASEAASYITGDVLHVSGGRYG